MGQFLAIGLATGIGVKKSEISHCDLSIDDLQQVMQTRLHHDPDLYTVHESPESYSLILRDDLLHAELIPLLQTLYPLLYPEDTHDDERSVIARLQAMPAQEWLQFSRSKPSEYFQMDKYATPERLDIRANDKYCKLWLYYEHLLLSLEGKIVMEVYGRQFNFLRYTMAKAFAQFRLAKALRVYLTG